MRVLITRPELQGRRTADKLEALGHEPVVFPLFRPVHDEAAARAVLSLPYAALAVTSAEAIRCLVRLGPSLAAHLDRPLFTVGRMTAAAAEEAGFTNITASTGNGADLAPLIAAAGLGDGSVLYLTSRKRSGNLEAALEALGVPLRVGEIYDMRPVDYSMEQQQEALVNKRADAVFLYSRENAKAFFALPVFAEHQTALTKTLFFCLSRNIADVVPEALQNSAVVSLRPDENELIDLL